MRDITITLKEGQRQAVLLALAKLSIERPGWDYMLNQIAMKMDNKVNDRGELYDKFRQIFGTVGDSYISLSAEAIFGKIDASD